MTTESTIDIIPCKHGRFNTCNEKGCGGPLTVMTPTLFSEAREERDKGMKRVDEAAQDTWKATADDAIQTAANRFTSFTVDAVWEILDNWKVARPAEGRAMGPRMTAAVKAGVIAPTDQFRQGTQPKSHANPRRVYVKP